MAAKIKETIDHHIIVVIHCVTYFQILLLLTKKTARDLQNDYVQTITFIYRN
jgi:hypothetical protein